MYPMHHVHATEDDRMLCEQVQRQEEELRILKGGPCPHCGATCESSPYIQETAPDSVPPAVVEETAPVVEELEEVVEELADAVEELTDELEEPSSHEEPDEEPEESGSVEELDVSEETTEEPASSHEEPAEERSSQRRFASRR